MNNFKRISVWLSALLAVASLACAVSIVTFCVGGARPDIFTKKQDSPPLSEAQLGRTFDYGDGYIKKMIFIGDKTVFPLSERYTDIGKNQVWSTASGSLPLDNNLPTVSIICSDDTDGASIPSAAERYRPQYLLITVGIENGVAYCGEEKFKQYYSELIEDIKDASPDTRIILQSIFPISKQAERNDPTISNNRIDTANIWIAELCEELSIRYLNTSSVLRGEDGYLLSDFDSGDGITLNSDGYRTMVDYIRTHGYK